MGKEKQQILYLWGKSPICECADMGCDVALMSDSETFYKICCGEFYMRCRNRGLFVEDYHKEGLKNHGGQK